MKSTRREWFGFAAAAVCSAQPGSDEQRQRIAKIVHSFGEQGIHRTGTEVDRISGDWLMDQVREAGLKPAREIFDLSRIDPISGNLSASGRINHGLPAVGGRFTGPERVRGRIRALGSDAENGLGEAAA